ncbi:hypothetical protein GE21DRAFT_1127359 [Neurospora crassa]|nr:hypothetical protein GE21DRAFT_1127359 [Neurospora crassa]
MSVRHPNPQVPNTFTELSDSSVATHAPVGTDMVSIFTIHPSIHHHLWISPCPRVWGLRDWGDHESNGDQVDSWVVLPVHCLVVPQHLDPQLSYLGRPSPVYRLSRTDTNDVVGSYSAAVKSSMTVKPLFLCSRTSSRGVWLFNPKISACFPPA